ncbi:thiol reductant ABC exporter, CydD subunit [Bordetella holmesii 30539]|uniref:Thiol reductant ABC exporter, CydD subunit n=3 Tax=Bordetella holmesii TaxID=35814 RepID=A0ABN0S407_9BORD|nr:thiol reductant ABC exporter subunit CydD [Bordetella holmesii]AIT26503.1 thiol reductant ABC exporter, CydD subunit [Bordetella holmesii 44057]EWM42143.1 thiol reductant ABC exporter, CydD subunit [Bordetella holmesii 41130]EWM47080.1 thiol reductant ABC exporter, CydD subunit [Bordetella holmesii 35009]EXF90099.1 thiol reductant ABC exporter, CydD subunit [Bordetella holmesii 30539]EXX96306.1 thiol reductant ABC exporter, CydD subunit [Bordetella holmesii 1058]
MSRTRLAGRAIGLAAAAPLLAGALLVVQAWLLAHVLHEAIVVQAPRAELITPILSIALLILLRACLGWVGERAGASAAESIKRQVRQALFARLLANGPQWSRERASGELASAMLEQVEALDGFFAKYLPAMGAAAVLPVAFSVAVLPFDMVSGLLLLVTAPLIPLFMALVGWGAESASRRHLQAFGRLSGFFADRLRGLSTLKLFGRAQAEAQTVVEASEALRRRTLSVLRIAFLSSAVLEFFAALGVAGVAVYIGLTYLGYIDIRFTPLTLQAGFFCLLMAPEVYAPLRQFAAHYHDRGTARAAVHQLHAVFGDLASEPAVPATPQPAQTSAVAASLSARRLTLRMPGRPQAVLDGVSLDLHPGEHVALMGASGAGKSSLLQAVSRLGLVPEGEILLDGHALAHWDEAALRERVAFIGQRPYLHAGTLADNIRLARPGADDAAVQEAARRACVLEFAQTWPEGLQTWLDGRGQGLSGGQAQRVALARLFLRDPALILLDEPTAHLDEATQERVLHEILAFAQGHTLIVATHASAVVRRLPRCWHLANGHLEAR